jgi:phytoene dehydrogenase-like protein
MTSAIVVGSGPNGLAAAVTLASEGVEVLVLEMAETIGGGTRTTELTLPGLLHDECSAAHPLAVDTPFSRRFDLRAHGLVWRWPEIQYSHPLDGGRGAAAYQSVDDTAAVLGPPDGRRWRAVFAPLAEQFDELTADFLRPTLHVPRHPIKLARFGLLSGAPADALARLWSTGEARGLFGGVAAHAFRPFGSPMSAAIGVALATAAHRYGWPVAEGGSASITTAMESLLAERGGRIETGVHVRSLRELDGADIVMLDTAPAAAVEIAGDRMPPRIATALARFRYGPAAFKAEFAVQDGVPWSHEPSRRAGTVHVGGSFDEIAANEKMIHSGRMPDKPFVLVCQQYLADPSRSNGDTHPVYSYAHVPSGWTGDATALIEAQIERFAPGFRDRILARHARSVAQVEEHNPNYVGGDIATGSTDPIQLVFRPRVSLQPYSLGIPGLYLCSAATPPGPGAHGMCGYNAARAALLALDPGQHRRGILR